MEHEIKLTRNEICAVAHALASELAATEWVGNGVYAYVPNKTQIERCEAASVKLARLIELMRYLDATMDGPA
jgi:hypothetical protein